MALDAMPTTSGPLLKGKETVDIMELLKEEAATNECNLEGGARIMKVLVLIKWGAKRAFRASL